MFSKRKPGRATAPGSWRVRPPPGQGETEPMAALGGLVFVVALLVSIALHELGHLLTAKRFGMKASRYFIGMGPTLWSRWRGETEYGVKAFPVGGFVKIVGMTQLEDLDDPRDEPRAFWRQP